MNDLVDFLRARLAEDEQAARQAADFGGGIHGYHWRVSGTYADDGGTYWGIAATAVAGSHEEVVEVVGCGVNSGGGAHTEQVAHHAARHDPARVLREVEAKRRMLALHAPNERDKEQCVVCDYGTDSCGCMGMNGGWPCETIAILALPYASHPDYRPEWVA